MDLLINENFDVELDDRNDLATVKGRNAAEQEVALLVNAYFYEEIGSVDDTNAIENIILHTQRVVNEHSGLEQVTNISAEQTDDGSIEVTIDLGVSESSNFIVG